MSTLPLFGAGRRGARDDGGERRDDHEDGGDRVYRVSQLNREVRALLEQRWATLWVEGEVSDFMQAASGHVYFTLSDEAEPAQVRVVMFKNDARRSKAKLQNGARVKLQGQLSLFTPRGSYQLIARMALPYGLGELHAAFERVRKKLEAEGLLAPERKRPLPRLPRTIGLVTSRTGAAMHDVIRVAHSRCPVRIVLSPCLVQGTDAPQSIVAALRKIQRLPDIDLIIVGRGGGSAEDLIAFNDERVARAIAECRVPTVSAVGHEVDISIADLVADVRAATPSNAAEIAVPERAVLLRELRQAERALARGCETRIGRERLQLERLARHLRDPRSALSALRARMQQLHTLLARRMQARLTRERALLHTAAQDVARLDPRVLLAQKRSALLALRAELHAHGRPMVLRRRGELAQLAASLSALSPLSILARGYAIALHEPTGKALVRESDAAPGDLLQVRLHEGTLRARVEPKA